MTCICDSYDEEYQSGYIDEYLCLTCGKHELKSTIHSGEWKAFVVGGCEECFRLPNTDGRKVATYSCGTCPASYVWSECTGWLRSDGSVNHEQK